MNAKQLEAAARKLCELRGIDPDRQVAHGADPSPDGFVPAVLLYSPAWIRAQREIQDWNNLRTAYNHGMTFA